MNEWKQKREFWMTFYKITFHHPVIEMNSSSPTVNYSCVSPGTHKSCNRSHQGLYNEIVTCFEEKNEFVKIIIPTIKYNFDMRICSMVSTNEQDIVSPESMDSHTVEISAPGISYRVMRAKDLCITPETNDKYGMYYRDPKDWQTRYGIRPRIVFSNWLTGEEVSERDCIPIAGILVERGLVVNIRFNQSAQKFLQNGEEWESYEISAIGNRIIGRIE